MTRLSCWEQNLAEYIAGKRDEPFAWGVNDCCTFCAGAVEAVTGVDPMPEFRGQYETRKGSAEALRKNGQGTLFKTLNAKFKRVRISHAKRGDLVFHKCNVGVVAGRFAWFVSDIGLIRLPLSDCTKAWRNG